MGKLYNITIPVSMGIREEFAHKADEKGISLAALGHQLVMDYLNGAQAEGQGAGLSEDMKKYIGQLERENEALSKRSDALAVLEELAKSPKGIIEMTTALGYGGLLKSEPVTEGQMPAEPPPSGEGGTPPEEESGKAAAEEAIDAMQGIVDGAKNPHEEETHSGTNWGGIALVTILAALAKKYWRRP
jgi:hypothetical protein